MEYGQRWQWRFTRDSGADCRCGAQDIVSYRADAGTYNIKGGSLVSPPIGASPSEACIYVFVRHDPTKAGL